MIALRPAFQLLGLFVIGMLLALLLQRVGALPGDALAAVTSWVRPAPQAPMLRGSTGVTALQPDVVRPAPDTSRTVGLVGDSDPTRNTLRRAVIVTAREALASPCSVDRRVSFQTSLRDYARAYASQPRQAGERTNFRTPLDHEAQRAIVAAHRGGVLEVALVDRWRGTERTGVLEILRLGRLGLDEGGSDPCTAGQRADRVLTPLLRT